MAGCLSEFKVNFQWLLTGATLISTIGVTFTWSFLSFPLAPHAPPSPPPWSLTPLTLTPPIFQKESRIQLPDTDSLIDPSDFKVFDASQLDQLDLNLPLKEQPYFIHCRNSGTTPTLHLESIIFRNAQQWERENRANSALRRQNTEG